MHKTKIERLVLFKPRFFFTEMGFIQKRAKKIFFKKKDAMATAFAGIRTTWPKRVWKNDLIYMIFRITWVRIKEVFIWEFHRNCDGTNEFVRSTIMFIIFWDFLMIKQIFFSLQVKQRVIISNKLVYTSCLTSCGTKYQEVSGKYQNFIELLPSAQSSSRNENFVSTSKNFLRNRNWTFLIRHYFTWKLEFVTNILWMIVSGNSFLLPIRLRSL